VAGYVLADFAKAEADWLDDLLRGISDGAAALADGEGAKFLNAVSLRTAPPRSSTGTQKKAEPAAPEPDPQPTEDTRSPLQKLVDRFK
jgi:PTH1 family peptidyl-tRNA hydrolase